MDAQNPLRTSWDGLSTSIPIRLHPFQLVPVEVDFVTPSPEHVEDFMRGDYGIHKDTCRIHFCQQIDMEPDKPQVLKGMSFWECPC